MSKQPEALRLADAIADACLMDGISRRQHLDERLLAAAELRRLHSLNAELEAQVEALKADAKAYQEKAEALVAGLVNEFVDVDFSSWPEMQGVQAEYLAKCDAFVLNGATLDAAKEAQK